MSDLPESGPFAELSPTQRHLAFPAIIGSLGDFRGRLLEVGFGKGDLSALLAARGIDVTAIDAKRTAPQWAVRRHPDTTADFVHADITTYRADQPFDAAVSTAVLHCATSAKELQSMLCGIAGNLREGAAMRSVFLHPEFQNDADRVVAGRLFRQIDRTRLCIESTLAENAVVRSPVITLFSKRQYETAAARAGFSSAEWTDLFPDDAGRRAYGDAFWGTTPTQPLYALLKLAK